MAEYTESEICANCRFWDGPKRVEVQKDDASTLSASAEEHLDSPVPPAVAVRRVSWRDSVYGDCLGLPPTVSEGFFTGKKQHRPETAANSTCALFKPRANLSAEQKE